MGSIFGDFAAGKTYFSITVSAVFLIPAIILYSVNIVLIIIAKNLRWQLKVVLLNLCAGNICSLVSKTFSNLGIITYLITSDIGCSTRLALSITGTLASQSGVAIYSIVLCIFIKYDKDRIKWHYVIISLSLSWTVYILFSFLSYGDFMKIRLGDDFCETQYPSFYPALIGNVLIIQIAFLIIFSSIIFHYLLKNPLDEEDFTAKIVFHYLLKNPLDEEDFTAKIAMSKCLFFILIASTLTILGDISSLHSFLKLPRLSIL